MMSGLPYKLVENDKERFLIGSDRKLTGFKYVKESIMVAKRMKKEMYKNLCKVLLYVFPILLSHPSPLLVLMA
jgi:hypothetical protein